MTDQKDIVGVVLAGGQSIRMGRDKAMLSYQGRPLIEHMIGLLRDAGCNQVVVSGDYPQYMGIADELYQRGPLGGLYSLYQRYADALLICVPVDMPKLSIDVIHRLINASNNNQCVRIDNYVLPMLITLNTECMQHLMALLTAPMLDGFEKPSLHALQKRMHVKELSDEGLSEEQFVNANSPKEWQGLSL